VFPGECK
jgi:hypothetical protein